MLDVAAHPLLDLGAFTTVWPRAIGEIATPEVVTRALLNDFEAPVRSDDGVRAHVRDLLRAGGFKPTGRSKPASEYLVRAASEGGLRSINVAVDACNAASLHGGLPISVVDLDRVVPPLRVAIAAAGSVYPFNPSGQIIDVSGLVALHDAEGPCANAVKDAQRTKTDATTTRTLGLVWGTRALPGRTHAVMKWFIELCAIAGGVSEIVVAPQ